MAELPQHIGYIVDGNRRWAKKHGLPTYEGHLAGYNAITDVALASFDAGVPFVSAYIFSTENWKRSEDEVGKLMSLVLRLLTSDVAVLEKNNVRLKILGSTQGVSEKILAAIADAEARTKDNTHGTLALCFNYGGQLEIADACKKIVQSGVAAEDITPELVAQNLYVPEIPAVDIVVRTSGEQRLSNFMLWRAVYSEFLFLEKQWPDMTKEDVTAILEEYERRGRRFGG
ncbi:polyprenyl diphosphate synthase [Streptomyces caniscabiei]|uniref:polyprenyl diphosphate synthase n=1 Tax=Streptomyces caniscabiei TaxID=2746961 RepID=UPI0029BA439C|nr:polyprenyl diphosphate synthase [Streptomyces caniscabiei]MDX2776221.1 polyprenyl diphosphate synthase [Streptomyces caniscabiei]